MRLKDFSAVAIGLLLFASAASGSEVPVAPEAHSEPMRLRLTETSLTETGTLSDSDIKLQTRGYGFTAILPTGLGVGYTMLRTAGEGDGSFAHEETTLRHNYLDVSYTHGDRFLLTVGGGTLIHGEAQLTGAKTSNDGTSATGKSLFIGPGFSIEWFEVYWIYRRNWGDFDVGNNSRRTLQSKHFQLGLGAHWTL